MTDNEYKNCPYCDEEIRIRAIKCRYCQSNLDEPSSIITGATKGVNVSSSKNEQGEIGLTENEKQLKDDTGNLSDRGAELNVNISNSSAEILDAEDAIKPQYKQKTDIPLIKNTRTLYIVGIIIMIFIAIWGIGSFISYSETNKEYKSGIEAYDNGNYDAALISLEKAALKNKNFKDVQSYIKLSREEIAKFEEEKALALSVWSFGIAKKNMEEGKYQDARLLFRAVIPADPNFDAALKYLDVIEIIESGSFYQLGNDAIDEGHFTTALENFKKVLKGNDYYQDAQEKILYVTGILVKEHLDTAELLLKDSRFDDARREIGFALKYNSNNEAATNLSAKTAQLELEYEKRQKQKGIDDYKAKCKQYEYRVLEKDADKLRGEYITQRGQIIQIIEEGNLTVIRLAVTRRSYGWSSSDVVYVVYFGSIKHYVNDVVNVWGTIGGKHTYTSVAGYNITVPKINAAYIE